MVDRNADGTFAVGHNLGVKTQFKPGHIPPFHLLRGRTPHNKGVKLTGERLQRQIEHNKRIGTLFAGKNHARWVGGKPDCGDCGKKLTTYKSKHCKQCFGKHMRGESAPRWQGGLTVENRIERVRFYRQVHGKILARDGFKCVECGQREYLSVDHIKKWADYPDLRFEPSNCRTLCMGCHYEVTFGRPMPAGMIWGSFSKAGIAS